MSKTVQILKDWAAGVRWRAYKEICSRQEINGALYNPSHFSKFWGTTWFYIVGSEGISRMATAIFNAIADENL